MIVFFDFLKLSKNENLLNFSESWLTAYPEGGLGGWKGGVLSWREFGGFGRKNS
jgi:hypothetical protein